MAESDWGLCKDCKWWQIEPDAAIENLTLGLCIEEKLQPFRLRFRVSAAVTALHRESPLVPKAPRKRRPRPSRLADRLTALTGPVNIGAIENNLRDEVLGDYRGRWNTSASYSTCDRTSMSIDLARVEHDFQTDQTVRQVSQ